MRMQLFIIYFAAISQAIACAKSRPGNNTDVNVPASDSAIIGKAAAVALGTLVDSGVYRIRGVSSLPDGPVVEVTGNTTAENAQIQQWGWFPNAGQKWRLIKIDSPYYKLVNLKSNKCLKSPSSASGEVLQQGTDDGSDSQRWAIAWTGSNNIFTLTNKATGMKMVVEPESNTTGAKIRQKTSVTGSQDLFEFSNLYFQNPLIYGSRPDPFVAQKDGYYYFLSTKGNRITITKTRSMSLLAAMKEITVWTPPTGTDHSSDIWAPELHFLSGKWYIYFAADSAGGDESHRMFVLENANTDPTNGTWTFKGKIFDPSDQWAIDGSVLTIGTTNYFIWSGWENVATKHKQYIYLATMSNPWTISGPRIKISSPTNDWERYEPNSLGLGVNEGPIMLQKDAASPVFIIYSASRYTSDNYCLAQIQLRSGGDPTVAADWINKKQVFVRNDANAVYGPGHNGFFTSSYTDANGLLHTENWFVYHARSVPATTNGARWPRMQKLTWNADGSPNFGIAAATGVSTPMPIGD